ncbi:hypothetical protein KC353_g58 [Hortaea werneckii]|nr:hypothetical protein KC353_g58 [Hortaea werneckii]
MQTEDESPRYRLLGTGKMCGGAGSSDLATYFIPRRTYLSTASWLAWRKYSQNQSLGSHAREHPAAVRLPMKVKHQIGGGSSSPSSQSGNSQVVPIEDR